MARLTLPSREGPRPETGPAVPHIQFTQPSPPQVRQSLLDWMTTALPGVVFGPSEIADPGAWAIFLDGQAPPPGAVLLPPRLTAELAHLHPDGSLHLALSKADQDELISRNWGERHPLYSPVINVVMLYAPRTIDELEIAQAVLEASYRYATGRDRVAANP
jgi:hypothetical protein